MCCVGTSTLVFLVFSPLSPLSFLRGCLFIYSPANFNSKSKTSYKVPCISFIVCYVLSNHLSAIRIPFSVFFHDQPSFHFRDHRPCIPVRTFSDLCKNACRFSPLPARARASSKSLATNQYKTVKT
ncbi:hypothetical protein J3R30DRAFT_3481239 [Lentinula aciculospora]|uniref:Uncharacterized protein n=1 Tax=Lentinula aciculospora TaxID=153920 RepID=A0A9W9AAN2_9AGAR|nr:hypothetical protein J3R30DRAFT_3481239 [Lentinula aciculospora]